MKEAAIMAVFATLLAGCKVSPVEHPRTSASKQDPQTPALALTCEAHRSRDVVSVSVRMKLDEQIRGRVYRVSQVMTVGGTQLRYFVAGSESSLSLASRLYELPDSLDFEINHAGVQLSAVEEPLTHEVWKIAGSIQRTVPPYSHIGLKQTPIDVRSARSIELELGYFVSPMDIPDQPEWKNGYESWPGGGKLADQQQVAKTVCTIQ